MCKKKIPLDSFKLQDMPTMGTASYFSALYNTRGQKAHWQSASLCDTHLATPIQGYVVRSLDERIRANFRIHPHVGTV